MKIGDLVICCAWSDFPGEVGQIIDFPTLKSALVLVRGEVQNFLSFDYDTTIEFYR